MDNTTSIREAIWNQFGASLDMLENAVNMCPEELWDSSIKFWYWSYHTAFWADFYLSTEPDKYVAHAPFTTSEFDPSGKMPDRTYTKVEILHYIAHSRRKIHQLASQLTVEKLNTRWINGGKDFSLLEMIMYNLRHIQHHTAQLNMLLRQNINNAPGWVGRAKEFQDVVA